MYNLNHKKECAKRRTFAIISHPDAGKTTITEKMLLFGNVIQTSGTIKGRGNGKYAKSDWMDIEKERGISVTTSVMQFKYKNILINLLDTPGHQDFSEDTYRILTAVDCCIVVIDAAKGIESRTKKLIDVTRIHNTPIITFINKLDRNSREPIEILDEIEKKLNLHCVPITWPISCGKNFKGVYHIHNKIIYLYKNEYYKKKIFLDLQNSSSSSNVFLHKYIGVDLSRHICEELDLIINIYQDFNSEKFLKGILTPIFFGSALGNFGIDHLLSSLVKWAPPPLGRKSNKRIVNPEEKNFTGFIFKIQANMDLKHRDRIAFMRIVSGQYKKGMKLRHVRTKKDMIISNVFSFLAGDRLSVEKSYPGDVIGLHNHGKIKIGDTFTQGEEIKFINIPIFSPEIFRSVYLKNPLKRKQLVKGLIQLSEEGTIQVFRRINNNNLILGAIGILQFDVVIERLRIEYNVDAVYKKVDIVLARWIRCENHISINDFIKNHYSFLAYDISNSLMYLAPSQANFKIISTQNSNIYFDKIRKQ